MSEPPAIPPEFARVLETRAGRLRARRAVELEEADQLFTAELALGDELFAFRLEALRGVVPLSRVTPVPLSPPGVIGVARFQGQLLTALSLPALLGGRAWASDPTVLLIAEVRAGGALVGFDCERVPRPSSLPRAGVEAARSARGAASGVLEVQLPGGQAVQLIEFEALLARFQGGASHGG
jgi:purine-binding chemotaxis protein CheW